MPTFCYDTEFLDDGRTIELISIGIVCEDGREYYAVNADCDFLRVRNHDWLRENVCPHLPTTQVLDRNDITYSMQLDRTAACVKPRWVIANEVREFLTAQAQAALVEEIDTRTGEPRYIVDEAALPQLWAYYGAYDHVALAQLWGPMSELPAWIPMFTHDLKQEMERVGVGSDIVAKPDDLHNALADARWNLEVLRHLRRRDLGSRDV